MSGVAETNSKKDIKMGVQSYVLCSFFFFCSLLILLFWYITQIPFLKAETWGFENLCFWMWNCYECAEIDFFLKIILKANFPGEARSYVIQFPISSNMILQISCHSLWVCVHLLGEKWVHNCCQYLVAFSQMKLLVLSGTCPADTTFPSLSLFGYNFELHPSAKFIESVRAVKLLPQSEEERRTACLQTSNPVCFRNCSWRAEPRANRQPSVCLWDSGHPGEGERAHSTTRQSSMALCNGDSKVSGARSTRSSGTG